MLKKLTRSEYFPVIALIAISLAIALLTVRHYGDSWDELLIYKYADRSLGAYADWLRIGDVPSIGNTYDNFGPFYVTLVTLVTRLISRLNPGWLLSDIRHFLYFVTFQAGVLSFYVICKRWMRVWAAFGATVLFATQPLLWGHAFISPKDIPFMTFFLASIALGLAMVEAIFAPAKSATGIQGNESIFDKAWHAWKETRVHSRWLILGVSLIWLLSVIALFGEVSYFNELLTNIIRSAYTSGEHTFLGRLFGRIASDAQEVPVDVYIQKGIVLFLRLKIIYFMISTALVAWPYRSKIPSVLRLIHPTVIAAGVMLGLTTSIRILGPMAGVLVGLYALTRGGKRTILLLLIYAGIAVFATYLTWPYLWPDPAGRFTESLGVMTQYPWKGRVLFNAQFYAANELPWFYLPVLLAIQFTEPVWVLFAAGFILVVWNFMRKRERGDLLLMVTCWFVLPLLGLLASHSPMYDNFRQIFFLLPPAFVIAGFAMDKIFEKVKRPFFIGLILAALATPGIVMGVRLHPYEYIYYNSYTGGVQGAFRRFELDYWCVSYREAANYLNQVAPPDAKVMVFGPAHVFGLFAREDIMVFSSSDETGVGSKSYDYAVITTRYNYDLTNYPDAEEIFRIQRDEAVLTVIRQLTNVDWEDRP